MPSVMEHLILIYEKLTSLEMRVQEIENLSVSDIDLPLPSQDQEAQGVRAPLKRGATPPPETPGHTRITADDPRVAAARARLAEDDGKVMPEPVVPEGQRSKVEGNDVVLPSGTLAQRETRKALAERLDLEADFPGGIDAYMKGGPLWLYYGNRDYVMGLSYEVKVAMIQDVEITSPQEAQEMSRDLLKIRGDGTDMPTHLAPPSLD